MDYRDKLYSKYFSSHTSHIYGESNLDNFKNQFPVWQKYFGKFLPENKNSKIVDLGCGNGGFIYWLNELGFQNVSGVDISEEQVELAKKIGVKNVFQADVRKFLADKSGEFDVIFGRDLIEHFNREEILDILEKIYFSLKDGGALVIQTANAENLLWGRLRYGDFTHELAFTAESLNQVLRFSGFKNISIYPQRPAVHGLKSLFRFILWGCFELKIRLYLLVETGSGKGFFTQNIIASARK